MRVDVRRGPARCLFLALVLTLASLPRAEAFPIPPMTLWELTHTAELVVWADVEEVFELPPKKPGDGEYGGFFDGDVARLRLREVWKGRARPGEQVEVHFIAGLVCPAPPRYEPGLAVVAFLKREDDGQWRTVALSYGTRYPTSNDEADAYRKVVARAVQAMEQWTTDRIAGKPGNLEAAHTDWQVLAASHPATRWDGLYELVPAADEHHAWYDGRAFRAASLSSAQREQLTRGFVERPPLDRSLPMMLMALRRQASKGVDGAAASALETVLADEAPPYWARLAFELLRERLGEKVKERPPLDSDPFVSGGRNADSGRDSLIQEWQAFKQRHQLEPKLLALPVEPPVSGTGGETPL